ncbi:hypothetical protein [Thauera sp.]|uniref:hypothetical protein n=1 Tax=Thauera sp. TaxID=1905334 RepID=UPI002CC9C50E|nr:hypothetical protein [Thauera sp.]HRO36959.1 hypothetical protein [Thauera sp.]
MSRVFLTTSERSVTYFTLKTFLMFFTFYLFFDIFDDGISSTLRSPPPMPDHTPDALARALDAVRLLGFQRLGPELAEAIRQALQARHGHGNSAES